MLISSQKYECEMRACPSPRVYLQSKQKKKSGREYRGSNFYYLRKPCQPTWGLDIDLIAFHSTAEQCLAVHNMLSKLIFNFISRKSICYINNSTYYYFPGHRLILGSRRRWMGQSWAAEDSHEVVRRLPEKFCRSMFCCGYKNNVFLYNNSSFELS